VYAEMTGEWIWSSLTNEKKKPLSRPIVTLTSISSLCRRYANWLRQREITIVFYRCWLLTSDLTGPAKKEAEQFNVDYWHGALVEQKLKVWGKWQPKNRRQTKAVRRAYAEISEGRSQVASGTVVVCICGSAMVQRRGKEGKAF
jgi:hypothetical protein